MSKVNFSLAVDLRTYSRAEFERFPAYTIGLDGSVAAPTFEDKQKIIANYNHHHGVDRRSTKATCEQVFEAVVTGLYRDLFNVDGAPTVCALVNDSDQDVSTSIAVLKNPDLVNSYKFSRLQSVEGKLDAYGGGYPFVGNMGFLRVVNWIYEPYTSKKTSGEIYTASAEEHEAIINECVDNIEAYVAGNEQEREVDIRYRIEGKVGKYVLLNRVGSMAVLGMANDGIADYAEIIEVGDRNKVTISTQARFKGGDGLIDLAQKFNEIEQEAGGVAEWGGGDAFCCSPRSVHSVLTRTQIEKVLAEQAA